MAGKFRGRLTFSNIVSVLALLFALGLGTAWAATELSKNEVTSKHIKNAGVKTKDIANNAVTSPKVADGSLLNQDFAAGQLPQGPQGEQGEQGPRGEQGPPGQNGATQVQVRQGIQNSCSTEGCSASSVALCEVGERAVGGGGIAIAGDDLSASLPVPTEAGVVPRQWQASVSEERGDDNATASVTAWVVCAAA
jgi:hypothetical protein